MKVLYNHIPGSNLKANPHLDDFITHLNPISHTTPGGDPLHCEGVTESLVLYESGMQWQQGNSETQLL